MTVKNKLIVKCPKCGKEEKAYYVDRVMNTKLYCLECREEFLVEGNIVKNESKSDE